MMPLKRIACAGLLIFVFFAAWGPSSVLAACPASTPNCVETAVRPDLAARIGRNFLRGTEQYVKTVGGWLARALSFFGINIFGVGAGENAACDEKTRCGPGLACLNICDDAAGCNTLLKRCVKASAGLLLQFQATGQIEIRAAFTSCGTDNLCSGNTICTRTCPVGVDCRTSHRCLPPEPAGKACASDDECRADCERRGFPPVGSVAIKAVCEQRSCGCKIEEADPNLDRTACPDPAAVRNVICLGGTAPACTTEACAKPGCPARATCLAAPEFGGQCLNDADCRGIACTAGAAPFCDADRRCRCRRTETVTVSCSTDAECSAIPCDPGQAKACVAGACACAVSETPATLETKGTACAADAECPRNCPEGYVPACRNGDCGCRRPAENVPVSCAAVADCAAVSCPSGYEKACLNNQCACTRRIEQ